MSVDPLPNLCIFLQVSKYVVQSMPFLHLQKMPSCSSDNQQAVVKLIILDEINQNDQKKENQFLVFLHDM